MACREALSLGAEVIIPGDGVLNAFLVRNAMMSVDGAVIMDPLGVLFQHAAFFVRARNAGCLDVSRRLMYVKPTQIMAEYAREKRGLGQANEADFSGASRQGTLD